MNATAHAEQFAPIAELPTVSEQHHAPVVLKNAADAQLVDLPAAANDSPFAMALRAIERGMSPEMIGRMLDLQERWEANEAKKAYNAAFAAFRAESIRVVRNKERKDGPLKGTKYADLFAVVDAVTPALSRHGLSHSWQITQDASDWIEVTCTLKHVRGYSESVSLGGPPDTSAGGKTLIQARASVVSYLERYTLKAVTGVAEEDDDDDGNGGNGAPRTTAPPPPPPAQEAFYPAADFTKNLPTWRKAIADGKKTPEAVIRMVETKAKLTEEQKRQIRAK